MYKTLYKIRCSYVHFFMIYVQAEGVPLNRPRDAITLGEVSKFPHNCPKIGQFRCYRIALVKIHLMHLLDELSSFPEPIACGL